MLWAGVLQWQPLSPEEHQMAVTLHNVSALMSTSTNTHRPPDKMYQSPAAPFCLALKSFVGHRAALSEATITPKIAIQDFGQERLWLKLWKNALKNDPLWELVYLLITMHLCIPVPTPFTGGFSCHQHSVSFVRWRSKLSKLDTQPTSKNHGNRIFGCLTSISSMNNVR